MGLRRIFTALLFLIAVLVLALVFFCLRFAVLELHQGNRGLEAINALRLVLVASEMASRERGPANGVLGDALPHDPSKQLLLIEARQRTDQALADLQSALMPASLMSEELRASLDQSRTQLVKARRAIDEVAAEARPDRTPEQIRSAVAEMFQVIDDLSPATLPLTREVQHAFPSETNMVLAARLASDLREHAGRLGSALTVALTRRERIELDDYAAMQRTLGRLDQLNAALLERTHAISGLDNVARASASMQKRYFGVAIPYVRQFLDIGLKTSAFSTDAAGFAQRYVPEMNSIVDLRNILLDEAQHRAQAEQADTRQVLYRILFVGVATSCLMISIVILGRNRVAKPFRQAVQIISEIASGKLDSPMPAQKYQDEANEIFTAIRILRDNDIERRRLEKERLRLSEDSRRFQEALDAVDSYVFLKDDEGRYIYANKAVRDLFGCSLQEIVGQTDERFFDISVSNDLRKHDRYVLELGARSRREEKNVIAATGETRYYWAEKSPLKDEQGNTIGLIGISTDISDKKRIEEALIKAHQETAKANENLSSALRFVETILLNSPLPMGVYAEDGQCIQANEAYANFIGGTREHLLKHNFHQLKAFKTSGLLDSCLLALTSNEPQHHEASAVTSFGKEVFCEYRILPITLENKRHLLIQFIDLSARKHKEDKLQRLAYQDPLTQLPNRRSLVKTLQAALQERKQSGAQLAVLFLDLNRFKQLNDSRGHEIGDLLLIEVAYRLRSVVRDIDTVARLGGDEFVVLLEMPDTDAALAAQRAAAIAAKLDAELSKDYVLGNVVHHGSASIGIKMVGADENDIVQILAQADAAMYEVKRAFKARHGDLPSGGDLG